MFDVISLKKGVRQVYVLNPKNRKKGVIEAFVIRKLQHVLRRRYRGPEFHPPSGNRPLSPSPPGPRILTS